MATVTKIPATVSRYTATPIQTRVRRKVAAYARILLAYVVGNALYILHNACGIFKNVGVYTLKDIAFIFRAYLIRRVYMPVTVRLRRYYLTDRRVRSESIFY